MEQSVINLLSSYVPMVQRYRSQFSSFNTLLGKTTLTGKISSLDIAENLFSYMEKTQEKFENLQVELINTIMEQNFLDAYGEAETSARVVADMLSIHIQSRHESILTLSKNKQLIDLAAEYVNVSDDKEKSNAVFSAIMQIMRAFETNYGQAYKDILLFKNDGTLLQHLNTKTSKAVNRKTKLQVVLDYSNVESYAEYYQKTDFYYLREEVQDENSELFFVVPLRASKDSIASIIAVFMVDIEGGMKQAMENFPYRLPQSNLALINKKDQIIFSENARAFPVGKSLVFNKNGDYIFLENRSKVCMVALGKVSGLEHLNSAMQGCAVCRIVPLYVAFDVKRQPKRDIKEELLEDSLLITEKLDEVIAEGENINEELGDVVINGEIIASKSHSYALNPILNNIRILSEEMNTLCIQSTGELLKGVYNALFNNAEYYAKYLSLAMDNIFAKAIKNASQIAENKDFFKFLAEHSQGAIGEESQAQMKALLVAIKQNFRYFYDILLFDRDGKVVQNSSENTQKGSKINITGVSSDVTLSNFEPSSLYNDKPTLLLNVYIKDSNRHLNGGLTFVLDFEKICEFLASILSTNSTISDRSEIIGVVFDSDKNVLLSSKPDFNFNEFAQNNEIDFKNLKKTNKIVKIGKKHYLMCGDTCNSSQSAFMAYTRKGLFAMVFVSVREDKEEN